MICDDCLRSLHEVDRFRSRCLEANEYFQGLALTEQESNKEDDYIEPICYTGYKDEVVSADLSVMKMPEIKRSSAKPKPKPKKEKLKSRYRPMCGYCGKKQESEYRLRQHELLSHTSLNQLSPDEVFVCDLCSRIFKTKQSLRNHFIRAHTPKTEVYPCSVCGKVLPHQKALYAHERIHNKSEESCQYCSKVFSRKVLLSSHIAIVHLKKRT